MSNLEKTEDESLIIHACRVCLDTKLVNYVQIDSEGGLWTNLYQFCTGLKVSLQSGSRLMCIKCSNLITSYAEFKKQCLKSEELWCSLLSEDVKCSINIINIKSEILPMEESNDFEESIFTHENKQENKEIEKLKEENNFSDRDFEELQECSFDESTAEKQPSSKRKWNLLNANSKWNCDKCKRRYKSKTWLISHLKSCQGKIKKIKNTKKKTAANDTVFCGLCDFTSDIDLMKQHLDIHALNNELNCGNCDFIGKDFACMVSHRYTHQSTSKPKLFCHLCDKNIGSSTSLQFHYRTVHLKKSGLDCTMCSKSFTTYKSWRNHYKWHRIDKFICDICGMKFLYRHAIEAHLIHHGDFNEFVCDTCGVGFKRLFNLRNHINRRHVTHKPVKCSHCNKIFKSDVCLQTHMRIVSKEKLFDCPVCPKKFPSEVTMKNHLFWHTDERPFACEICGSKYKAKSQLKIHMRQHTGIMPFKCQSCDKGFPSSNQLKIHMSVHTGVRRHKCGFCPRTFHNRKLVESHCAVQHKDREMKLDIAM